MAINKCKDMKRISHHFVRFAVFRYIADICNGENNEPASFSAGHVDFVVMFQYHQVSIQISQ